MTTITYLCRDFHGTKRLSAKTLRAMWSATWECLNVVTVEIRPDYVETLTCGGHYGGERPQMPAWLRNLR
jgi:hypothetical protein